MDLSIIVTSFQRAHLLCWNFTSLLKQSVNFKYEILVLNDGQEDGTRSICHQFSDRLPIRYIFTGQRNTGGMKWRIPGFAINIGAKLATGKSIVITCAEMFLVHDILQEYVKILNANKKAIVITEGKDDRQGLILHTLQQTKGEITDYSILDNSKSEGIAPLNTEFPFFMGINRQEFIDIGGYDEDFIGMCWDDMDVVMRLKKNGCHIVKLPYWVIHLYHKRLRYGMQDVKDKWVYNEKLYYERINQVVRNQGREWGCLT